MYFWLPSESRVDVHGAFRSVFSVEAATTGSLRLTGSAAFRLSLDGRPLAVGPCRFTKVCPEYEEHSVKLHAGKHVLAIEAHYDGVETRLWPLLPPFLFCELVLEDDKTLPLIWKGVRLDGFDREVRRINPQLGWIEWCESSKNPSESDDQAFGGEDWPAVAEVDPKIPAPAKADLGPLNFITHSVKPSGVGELAEVFGYERDDIPARFFLRDLNPAATSLPAGGIWRRYDFGRVRLVSPRFVLDLPAGAVVEFAGAEFLTNGRVAPYIPLSAGSSCNLDHYVARGGPQEFCPISPRGGRFWEVHVLAAPEKVRFVREEFEEKAYYRKTIGHFESSDPLLNRIWETGVETFRACCEDALTDNPTRERGQWLGDAATVGMEIAAAAFTDRRPIKRSLVQSALCAREDGLVAGLTPGGVGYLSSYALLWVEACWRYFKHTGDRGFLEEMMPYARRNLEAFLPSITAAGLGDSLKGGDAWIFIDWAYQRPDGAIDPAYNLYFLNALRALDQWATLLEQKDLSVKCRELEATTSTGLRNWLANRLENGGWEQVGWHSAGLLLGSSLLPPRQIQECTHFLKQHFLACFPNQKDAPRLSAPGVSERKLISPFYCHFVFPALIDVGEIDFVLEQMRSCWGWALGDGRTTWLEVFDTRWSHCHQWSGCPTWILSRYLLGLHPRADLGPAHFEFRMTPSASVQKVSGVLPISSCEGEIKIQWERTENEVHLLLRTREPIWLHLPDQPDLPITVEGEWRTRLHK